MDETTDETGTWEGEVLVLTIATGMGDARKVVQDTAAELALAYGHVPHLGDHIRAVAMSGGEGTAFTSCDQAAARGTFTYHVRRATRAEALGQEDRLHEDDEEETCRLDQGECCPPDRCSCGLAHMGEHGEDHAARQAEKDAHDDASGRYSSDAYDEEVLREQLGEALDALQALLAHAEVLNSVAPRPGGPNPDKIGHNPYAVPSFNAARAVIAKAGRI